MVAFMLTAKTNNDSLHRTCSTLVKAVAFAISPLARALHLPVNAIKIFLHEQWQFLPQTCTHWFAEPTQPVSSWASLPPTRTYHKCMYPLFSAWLYLCGLRTYPHKRSPHRPHLVCRRAGLGEAFGLARAFGRSADS